MADRKEAEHEDYAGCTCLWKWYVQLVIL
jgi:hypothetical protein